MSATGLASAFSVLGQFAGKRSEVESCELCAAPLAAEHPHLVDPKAHKLICACQACAILFSAQAGTKYQRVPNTVRHLADFQLSDAAWDSLLIPINVAFFFRSSADGRIIAQYPSAAGATESLLPMEAWSDVVESNPVLAEMVPDVEALLVNRLGPRQGYAAHEYYLAPIDECYKLTYLIRANWQGFSGGTEVWKRLETFFAELKARARTCHA